MIEKQCAALPVRRHSGKTEVLLVTSRETRRWVIPKGWPINGLTHAESAAREALEEAGIEGKIGDLPVGNFHYGKRRKDGTVVPCSVDVYRLDVGTEHADWHESHQRERKWVDAVAAARLVAEPELAELIRTIAGEQLGYQSGNFIDPGEIKSDRYNAWAFEFQR